MVVFLLLLIMAASIGIETDGCVSWEGSGEAWEVCIGRDGQIRRISLSHSCQPLSRVSHVLLRPLHYCTRLLVRRSLLVVIPDTFYSHSRCLLSFLFLLIS